MIKVLPAYRSAASGKKKKRQAASFIFEVRDEYAMISTIVQQLV